MTFHSFCFTSKTRKQMLKNRSKNAPKSTENWNWTPSKTTLKKTTGKRGTESIKSQKLLPNWVSGGGPQVRFNAFSSLGASWNQNGHKTSSKSLWDTPGHQFLSIFIKFLMFFFVVVIVLGPIPGAAAGAARRATGYIYMYMSIHVYIYIYK